MSVARSDTVNPRSWGALCVIVLSVQVFEQEILSDTVDLVAV